MITYRDKHNRNVTLQAASRGWEVLAYSTERESDGAIVGWHLVGHKRPTWRAAASFANRVLGTRIPRGPVRPLKVGDVVKHSDIVETSIQAYKALRGTVLELRGLPFGADETSGNVALVKWTCDSSPSLINVSEITQEDDET